MRSILLLLVGISFQFSLNAQVIEFDLLEMKYDQGHYKNVYRNAKKLLDDPAYDFSYLPKYYLALSQLQLAQNNHWLRKNKYALKEAKETLNNLMQTYEGRNILRAHQYEISTLRKDLTHWMYNLKNDGDEETFLFIKNLVEEILPPVPDVSTMKEDIPKPDKSDKKDEKAKQSDITKEKNKDRIFTSNKEKNSISSQREKMVDFSTDLLGVPYQWGGESPSGFDCSGFTSYVITNTLGTAIPRSASIQYQEAKKIKRKEVQPGDFVFFRNSPKSRISHVGIIYSTNDESIQMIHASSSIGISIVDIYQSSYWKRRVTGFGTYIKEN